MRTVQLVAALALAGALAACSHAPPSASPARANPTAMRPLFDGKTLTGWQGDPSIWSVKDGAIDGNTQKGGFLLYTDGDYDDFRLVFKSRLVSEKNHLGVCFWGDREPDFRYGKCLLVIPPDGGMWDYMINGTPKRDKFPHDPPFDPHQWHTTEILAHRASGRVDVAVDGFVTTHYVDVDPSRLRRGPIGLQIHGGASEVQYKDIEIEVSPGRDELVTRAP